MSYGVNAPQGFVPYTTTTGATFNASAVQFFNIDPAQASNSIFLQDAVITSHSNGGSWIARIATAANTSAVVAGTFVGCQYVVPQAGAPNGTVINGYWPGNAGVTVAGTSVTATVLMDQTIIYDVQSTTNGGVTAAQLFFNAQIAQPANGNVATGISGQSIIAEASGNATFPVKIVGFSNGGGGTNLPGINFNNVYTVFNTPAFATNTVGL